MVVVELARLARHLPDRILHARRRRLATRRLRSLQRPRAILFICHGNICRSPYAAAVARRLLPDPAGIASAGFIGPGRASPPEAIAAARESGIDLTPHRSQLVTPRLLEAADLVLVMDVDQRRRIVAARPALAGRTVLLGDLDPRPITTRAIPDPVNQPVEAFRSCYARVERCSRALSGLWSDAAARSPR